MASTIQNFIDRQLISPPKHIKSNLVLEVLGGSRGYGIFNSDSDYDLIGISIPPKINYFPNSSGGFICDFDDDIIPKFHNYNSNKIIDNKKEYEITVYGIARFFNLALGNNPNIIDVLYYAEENIKYITEVGHLIRDNRNLFLSKLCWPKMRCYAASQAKKVNGKQPIGKRLEVVEKFGYDIKFAAHALRLLCYSEDIITKKTIDMYSHSQEILAVKKGEWTLDRFNKEFECRKIALEEKFHKCDLPEEPDRNKIRELLIRCLERHWGKLGNDCIDNDSLISNVFKVIDNELDKIRGIIYK